jgi:membrane protease YdiL (CAAX protease family)
MHNKLHQIKEDWLDLFAFLKAPNENRDENQNTFYRLSRVLSIFILNLIVVSVLVSLMFVIERTGIISTENHKAVEMLTSNPALALFAAVIIAPFFEELIFRTYIVKKYSPIHLIAFLAGVTGKQNQIKVLAILENYWHKYYKLIIYFSALLFGYVHIFNYEISQNILWFSLLLVSPQICIGLCLAYFRIRFGLVWAMGYHAFYNLILIGPALFFY